jgi:hypothetical protein
MKVREEIAILPLAPAGRRAGIPIGGTVTGPVGSHAIGIVDKVVLAPATGELTHLLIRCFGKVRYDVLVPIAGVDSVHDGMVRLNVPVEQLTRVRVQEAGTNPAAPDRWTALPGYEPDQVLFALPELANQPEEQTDEGILEQALDALRSYGPTRHLAAAPDYGAPMTATPDSEGTLRVSVRNGVVILAGNVELRTDAGMVERLVRRVTGVREVLNLLVADDELQTSVAAALHYDPRTRTLTPNVCVAGGLVTLIGSVADARSRDAVEDVVGGVPGVRGVVNRLAVGR